MPTPPATYYTTAAGPGAASPQAVPSHSLGGFAAATAWAGGVLGDLFNIAQSGDVADARADYRAVYVANRDPVDTLADVRVYLTAQTAGAQGLSLGLDPRPVTDLDAMSPQAVAVATAYAAPAGVSFAAPAAYAAGLPLGDLPPGTGRAVWLRRVPLGAAGSAVDTADVTAEALGGAATVRRVVWETAPYARATRPLDPPVFLPTPSPFRRVGVDFLTAGGARVVWDLDPTLVDDGPYDFQLQASQSGVAGQGGEDDWADVGPPARDAFYLLDPDQRLWGMSSTLHYRVLLTTAAAAYTSPPANVFGLLTQYDWLLVREVFRKERLALRQFTGVNGFLLKAKRYGPRCTCTNPTTGETNNSACPYCYGVGITGGYHPPVPSWFANTENTTTREYVAYNENLGTVKRVNTTARMLADLPVLHKDAWCSISSDERYYIHTVKELVNRVSSPVVLEVELRMAPRSDVLYTLPLARPDDPPPDWKAEQTLQL